MDSYELFAGKAYTFPLDGALEEGANYDLVLRILSDYDNNLTPNKVTDVGSNESYDEYRIECEERLYTLKISLDKDCQILKSEINFLKENRDNDRSALIPKYYHSGLIKLGSPVLFLLSSYEDGFSLDDLGLAEVENNLYSFFVSLYNFRKLDTKRTPEEYFNLFFDNFSIENGSEFLISNIKDIYNFEEINAAFREIREEILSTYNPKIIGGDTTCHGFLSKRNIITRNSLFKFKNPSFTFKGNKFFDLAFALVSVGLSARDRAISLKFYCDALKIEFSENREQIDHCIHIASAIYFYKLFFDFLIEECLFQNSRPERVLSLISDYSNSSSCLRNLSCYGSVNNILDRTITRQIKEY